MNTGLYQCTKCGLIDNGPFEQDYETDTGWVEESCPECDAVNTMEAIDSEYASEYLLQASKHINNQRFSDGFEAFMEHLYMLADVDKAAIEESNNKLRAENTRLRNQLQDALCQRDALVMRGVTKAGGWE